jgi:hypothetical protein
VLGRYGFTSAFEKTNFVTGAFGSSESQTDIVLTGPESQLPPVLAAFEQTLALTMAPPRVYHMHTWIIRLPLKTFASAFALPSYPSWFHHSVLMA